MIDALLSVIVPVYNTEIFLKRCIESINHQTYKNIEIIVVDDGSDGDIRGLLPVQNNIKFVKHTKNMGLFKARITGYNNSKGHYICFLDSDDYVSPDYYRSMIFEAEKYSLDIVAGDTVFEKYNGKKYIKNLHEANFGKDIISGDNVKKAYFSQEATSFVWHTIWNKIYKRSLWEKCINYLEKINRHLVMTEDILFSSILFFNAESFLYVPNEGYRYCENISSSTNNNNANFEKFKSNISDIKFVFDSVDNYLKSNNADSTIINHAQKSREFYSRIWRSYQINHFKDTCDEENSKRIIECLAKNYDNVSTYTDHFFEILETYYDPTNENIKNIIISDKCEVVSFDIFDTLITRPFYKPNDIFILLDEKNNGVENFSKIRTEAEKELRLSWHTNHQKSDDFTLNDIYSYIKDNYQFSDNVLDNYRKIELSYEKTYCEVRKFAKSLFDLAMYMGKRIVLISDMYLDVNFIKELLDKNDIHGYEKLFVSSAEGRLKYNGKLYDIALAYLKINPRKIVHIGDDWNNDFVQCKTKKITPILLPKTMDVMDGKIENINTNSLGFLGEIACPQFAKSPKESLAYRTMIAMISTKLFDNPYPSYNDTSNFNASAEAIGYYPVGMHLMGICRWLKNKIDEFGAKSISFLSRDGFLPKKAFDICFNDEIKTKYIYCSRRCLLPWMIDDIDDLYNLPINLSTYSPKSMCSFLEFCIDMPLNVICMQSNVHFKSKSDYHKKMQQIFKRYFSISKLNNSKETSRQYYRTNIEENSLVFDMGYSGFNAVALSRALGYHVKFLYIYKTEQACNHNENRYNIDVETMYDFVPKISGFVREYLLSENKEPCIGFASENGEIVPKFDEPSENGILMNYAVNSIQHYALEFVKDYCGKFRYDEILFRYNPVLVSLPFESMMVNMKDFDCFLFKNSYSEDVVYSNDNKVSLYDHWTNLILENGTVKHVASNNAVITVTSNGIHDTVVITSPLILKIYKGMKLLKRKFSIKI